MTQIQIADQIFDVDAIAFDKDGTLVDFNHLWGTRTKRWIDQLIEVAGGSMLTRYLLCGTLGYDGENVVPDSPMAVGTMGQLYTLAAGVLFSQGMGWHEAEVLVAQSAEIFENPPALSELQPTGDLGSLFAQMTAAGIQVAVNTSDNRAGTLATLDLLNISQYVSATVCGDDGLPAKPDPTSLLSIAEQLDVSPARMLFVGDTVSDLTTGKRAGTLATVGILGGGGNADAVRTSADVVVTTLDQFQVVGCEPVEIPNN
ncbi:MAG: HAD family hydrolase [Candidatus Promineifilaceae bacterium]